MSDTLLVPITLEILLANNALRGRDSFRAWRHSYAALRDFCSPEPMAFDCDIEDDRTGAFLHWTLPRSLRASQPGSSTDFPLVPNRWLIHRVSHPKNAATTPTTKSWVVESDHLQNDAARASYFLVKTGVLDSWNSEANAADQISPMGMLPAVSPAPNAYPVNMGKAFVLEDWAESTARPEMFLKAIAPGNLEFSGYVPFNEGVFSFFDELSGVSSGTKLSYQVIGWYSDARRDVVAALPPGVAATATAEVRSAAVLAALNWQLPRPAGAAGAPSAPALDLKNSLYHGTATGLLWDTRPNAFSVPDELEVIGTEQNLDVAVANNSVDAFSTLVGRQLAVKGYQKAEHVIELLRAFHYDLLPLLNQPNGSELLGERIRQEWFSSRAGGTQWAIVAAPPAVAPGPATPAPLAAPSPAPLRAPLTKAEAEVEAKAEAKWLQDLNKAQREADECLAELISQQWALHAAWWKKGYYAAANQPANPEVVAQLEAEANRLQDAVLATLRDLNTKLAKVPSIDRAPPEAGQNKQVQYLAAIEKFIADDADKFSDGTTLAARHKTLKAVPQARFWLPNNPSVLISRVQPSEIANPDSRLPVRLARAAASGAPAAQFAKLPGALQADAAELHGKLLRQIAPTTLPTSPPDPGETPPTAWQQQWHPMYLEWEVAYTDVPYLDPVTRHSNWRFNGTDYELRAALRGVAAPQLLSGRSLLSPNAQLTFGARLKKFVEQFQSEENDLHTIWDDIQLVDDWKFLSQELVGFNEWLTQRDTRVFRTPAGEPCRDAHDPAGHLLTLEKIMGFPTASRTPGYDTPAAAQGLINSVPAIAPTPQGRSAFPFHAVRSGQLYINHLVLYDKFGRKLDLIAPDMAGMLDANVFPLIRDAALRPTVNLMPEVEATVQLPPRLLQPARLDLLLVDQQDRTLAVGQGSDANPVAGWLLANHLDQALLIFAPDGSSLGEIVLNHTGSNQPRWVAPPHHPVAWLTGLDDDQAVAAITARFPRLGGFVTALRGKTAAEFHALLHVIDSTLWTVDPLGSRADQHLSVLVGRPLALLALQVQFSLYGPPLTGCDWQADDAGASPLTNGAEFGVRLGNQASREDGVIGYFTAEKGPDQPIRYDTFHSVVAPASGESYGPGQLYVRPIGPLGGSGSDGDGNYLTLALGSAAKADLSLLVDPRATIHAATGLLPVKTLVLPPEFVHEALARMEISFKVGPLLSRIRPVPVSQASPAEATVPAAAASAAPAAIPAAGTVPSRAGAAVDLTQALSYLPISEKNGTWSWWEKTGAEDPAWQAHALIDATTAADLGHGPASLREGYLQFRASLEEDPLEPHSELTDQ